MDCPQCRQPIEMLANNRREHPDHVGAWGVGWCRQEIHLDCFILHARGCAECRWHNAELIARQDLVVIQREEARQRAHRKKLSEP